MKCMKRFKRNEKGFSLIELLVAIPIIGLLGLAMGAVLIQLLHSDRISQRMVAVRQVQAAGDRVSTDGVQAQVVEFNESIADPYDMTDPNWYLNMEWTGQWTEPDGTYISRSVVVKYYLEDNDANGRYDLKRKEWFNVPEPTDLNATAENTVAQHLDPTQMSCEWVYGTRSFSFKVVSVVGTKVEERTYNISPRSL